jgi:hypothetical protein
MAPVAPHLSLVGAQLVFPLSCLRIDAYSQREAAITPHLLVEIILFDA